MAFGRRLPGGASAARPSVCGGGASKSSHFHNASLLHSRWPRGRPAGWRPAAGWAGRAARSGLTAGAARGRGRGRWPRPPTVPGVLTALARRRRVRLHRGRLRQPASAAAHRPAAAPAGGRPRGGGQEDQVQQPDLHRARGRRGECRARSVARAGLPHARARPRYPTLRLSWGPDPRGVGKGRVHPLEKAEVGHPEVTNAQRTAPTPGERSLCGFDVRL